MEFTTLGITEQKISRIAYGGMSLRQESREDGKKAVHRALELGVNFFDTADIYGGGASEEILGEALREAKVKREDVVIASKCSVCPPNDRNGYRYKAFDLSADHIVRSCEASLKRLDMDYIDLYQPHRVDHLAHPDETAAALDRLRGQCKIRMAGVSNYNVHQIRALGRFTRLDSLQVEFNILHHDPLENGQHSICMETDMRLLCWSPVAKGLLTDAVRHVHDERRQRREGQRAQIAAMAQELGVSTTQAALAWLLHLPGGIVPLVGTKNPDHIEEAVKALDVKLPRDVWYELLVIGRGQPMP
jgi:aryl-alcohol dehydrogenase-like predicted oxidoreductase